ncbi:hypothetical protein OAR46_01430 [Candidatus Pelagibacter sp.]|jgi:nucleoside-diphosphate-sugar epimerase|nr:hypothetical protein [Candidatus Pelagibacter sp.]
MNKILIIGKKSFLGSHLKQYLLKKFKVDSFSFNTLKKKKLIFFNQYSHVINTSIHPLYVRKKYDENYDLDIKFIKRFKKINFYYIFFNTRKIYLLKNNITEKSKIKPLDNYSKNKYKTEVFLKRKIKNKLISLRISNIIGKRIYKNNRNHHKLFFDNFLNYRKNKKIITANNDFKDFLSIDQFCLIILKIIKSKINGIYNVSISEKIYISELISWIDKKFLKKVNFINNQPDSFTLSNKKLIKKIKIELNKNQLMNFCKKLI